ncbi:hypothetical protein [Streptomyces collinus]
MYASINACGIAAGTVSADPAGMLASQRTAAVRQRELLLRTDPQFSRMPKFLKTEVLAVILVELIELAGRARRGGTPVELYLVGSTDGAPASSPIRRALAYASDSLEAAEFVAGLYEELGFDAVAASPLSES